MTSGMRGEAEVVVRGEVVQGLIREAHERAGGQAGHAQAAAQMALVQVGEGFLQEVFEHRGGIFNRRERRVHRGEV